MTTSCSLNYVEAKTRTSLAATTFTQSPTIRLHRLEDLTSNFEKNIYSGNTVETGALSKIKNKYGEESFNASLITFNNFIKSEIVFGTINATDTPSLFQRTTNGVSITPLELAEIMDGYAYDPQSLTTACNSASRDLIRCSDNYYSGRFSTSSMTTFCALAPSIFGALESFFSNISSIADKLSDIIQGISDFSVANILETLKSKIISVIEKQFENIALITQNLTLSNVISGAQEVFHQTALKKFYKLKSEALQFFSKENLDAFKKRIEGLISYAVSIFKNPSLEEIQYLVYRFCNFIMGVEDIISSVNNPLINFRDNYDRSYKILQSNSSINTVNAVAAGAIRYETDTKNTNITSGVSSEVAVGNVKQPSREEIENVTKWNNGKGDDRINLSVLAATRAAIGVPGHVQAYGNRVWDEVDIRARVLLMRVQAKFGKTLIINSGWRPQEYNDYLRSIGTKGVAPNSLHIQKLAMDVTWSGFNTDTKAQFIDIAIKEGFTGIGRNYSSFVHVDIGPKRSW